MRIIVHDNYEALSKWTAYTIAQEILSYHPSADRPFVLGIPAGQSPIGTFQQLVSLNQQGTVSFEHVVVFGLNEFVGIPQDHPQSHYSVLWNNFFSRIDIVPDNVHLLEGNAPNFGQQCEAFESEIAALGGMHVFLGSIAPDGHIGFNEPGSSLSSRTRIKTLAHGARAANAHWFGNDINKVPKTGLTMGLATIMDAKKVIVLISGFSKARALQRIVETEINHMWTVSMLQLHRQGMIVCDDDATMELKVGTVKYFKDIEKDHLALPEL
ncbi:MAG: glucosamine-6-phosphate deaminase [Bacteroidetes bacterium]|jgi:glucosamine-6-phosphate deaminase|nr:glucosamine-6-phosphate deaminase [Bacteroidota bacterium]